MGELSMRVKLTLWYAAILVLGLALAGGALYFSVARGLVAGIDQRLAQRAEGLRTVLEIESADSTGLAAIEEELAEFAREVPDGNLIEIRAQDGRMVLPREGEPVFPFVAASGPSYRTLRLRNRNFRVYEQRIEYKNFIYDVVIGGSLDEVRSVAGDVRNLLLTIFPAVLLLAAFGGYWISRRALAPVGAVTRAARSISLQNLSERLPVPRTGDELQRLSETWNDMLTRLEASVQRITRFTADASHELRTPIALIRAAAELALRRDREREEYRRTLEQILAEADRMTRLAEDLLTLARSGSDQLTLPLAPVDLRAIVGNVIEESQPLAELQGIRIAAGDAGDKSANVSAPANEAALHRLLLILIDNAIQHTPPGGTIQVCAERGLEGCTISVADTGRGIDPADLPHIFDRFYRADPARNRNGGAGLGLSIAQAIAKAHGSEIQAESAPGAGSRFTLQLRDRREADHS